MADQAARLRQLRAQAYELVAALEALHRPMVLALDPAADEDPLELAVRSARYQALNAAQRLHDAVQHADAELAPMGRVRRP